MKCYSVTIQMKPFQQYFQMLHYYLFSIIVLTFESVDEMLQCYHSNETISAVISDGAIYLVLTEYVVLTLSLWAKLYCVAIQTKPLQRYFQMLHYM